MGRTQLPSPERLFSREAFELFDDFSEYITTDLWTDIQSDGTATVTFADGMHSVVKMLVSADNDEAVLYTTIEQHKLIANTPLYAETRFLFTDGATATSNATAAFGFVDAFALDAPCVDGGATVNIPNTGAVIWKKSEGLLWNFESSVAAGTQSQNVSTSVPQSSSYVTLAIDCVPRSASVFECRPFIDGKQMLDNTTGNPIMQTIVLGTSVDMQLGWGLKGGHADDATLFIDYIYASQGRTA